MAPYIFLSVSSEKKYKTEHPCPINPKKQNIYFLSH